jgi:hypothetical protein
MKYGLYLSLILLFPFISFSSDWELKDSIGGKELISFCCRDTNNCYAVVQYADSTRILKSTDQGATWFRIFGSVPHYNDPTPIPEIINSKWGISPGKNFFYMVDLQAPVIRKSTDDCKTFIDIAVDSIEYSGRRMPQGFDMLDTNIGFLITGINLFVTKNGWKTFEKLPEPITGQYLCPRFINDSIVAMLCGLKTGMKFVKYNINQKNMEILFEFPKDSILDKWYSVMKYHFVNDSVGFGCGYLKFNPGGGAFNIIFKTRNGGKDWKLVYKEINSPSFGLLNIAFYDENNGVAVAQYGNIIITNDGGESWVLDEKPAYTGEPLNMETAWAGHNALVGTMGKGGIFRYEGDFFNFDIDTLNPVITAEDKDFGKKDIESQDSTFLTFKIYNNNNGNELKIFGYSALTNSAFTTNLPEVDSLNPIVIQAQEFYEYEVYFKPNAVQQYSDSIVFYSNAKKTDNIAYLTGEGIAFPAIQAENQDFKTKEIHDTTTTIKNIKIHNLSDYSDLNIFGFSQPTETAFTNQFVWNDSMTYITVKPNEYFELPVSFKPTEMRKYKDSIIVYSNATKQDSVILLEGEGIDSTIGVVENLITNYQLLITPNPASEEITMQIKSPLAETCRIRFFNSLGMEVKNININLISGMNELKMDINDFMSGIYLYNIEINGNLIKLGKMNIVR